MPRSGWYIKDHAKVTQTFAKVTVCYTTVECGKKFGLAKQSYTDDGYTVSLWSLTLNVPNKPNVLSEFIRKIFVVLMTTFHIYKCVRGDNFDLVISHGFRWGGGCTALIRRILPISYIAVNHSSSMLPYSGIKKHLLHFIEKTALEVWYVSKPQYNKFKSISSKHPYFILGNPIDTDSLKPTQKLNRNDEVLILLVGIPCRRKGIDILITSVKQIIDKNQCLRNVIKVDIIGQSSEIDFFKNMAIDYGVDELFNFRGFLTRKELISSLQKCSFLVAPSRDEGFSYAVAEALSCGKPVVTTACGGPEWFVTDEVGIVCNNGDTHSFSEGLEYMLKNYERYDPWVLHQHIVDRFSYKVLAVRMLSRLRKLLNQNC